MRKAKTLTEKLREEIETLEKRVAALEDKATATTWNFGKIDFPALARLFDIAVKPSAIDANLSSTSVSDKR